MDNEPPVAKPTMYALTNPDPLRAHTARALAAAAGCSVGTISDLRTGKLPAVSERLARSIAAAVGSNMDSLFQPAGRVYYQRT